ncbi:hypothetical protein B5X24_HaOG212845 [Helicoverpa armigera]|nr:hypothetical protein B5X24_HaOG212845 [Helicoverpa armigera]
MQLIAQYISSNIMTEHLIYKSCVGEVNTKRGRSAHVCARQTLRRNWRSRAGRDWVAPPSPPRHKPRAAAKQKMFYSLNIDVKGKRGTK